MKIACDIDDIICDTTRSVLDVHNKDTGDNLTLDDIKSYHIEDYVSPEYRENFHKIFLDKRVWKGIRLLPNCVETVQQIHNAGHEIWFVTSTMPENALKKCNFLERTFPFLDVRNHFITTPYKQMIGVDILIDDAAHNVVNAPYSSILFDYPWNRDLDEKENPNVYRVSGWSDVLETVELIKNTMNSSWNYDMEKCPLDTKVYLLSRNNPPILPQKVFIGTITHNGSYRTRGECYQGDPDCFYRSAIIAWKPYNKS